MKKQVLYSLLWISFLFAFAKCTKDGEPPQGASNQIVINTRLMSLITSDSAQSGGDILEDGGDLITERGVCWNTAQLPTVSNNKSINGTGGSEYISQLFNLNPNTTYYVRAYAISSQGTIYGNQIVFKTLAKIPAITTSTVTNITSTSCMTGGSGISDGGQIITQKGICWSSVNKIPTISDNRVIGPSTNGNFNITVSNLSANTTYYVRAFATSSAGTGYGAPIEFRTAAPQKPLLSVVTISSISTSSVTASASIVSSEGATVTEYGHCWGLSPNPTISNSKATNFGTTSAVFSNVLGSLSSATRYYVRAYARNSAGVGYSLSSAEFMTASVVSPTLATPSISSIGVTSAILSSSILSAGGGTITERGFYISRNNPPTESNSTRYQSGSGSGSFSVSATGLLSRTTYFVRSYARNSAGITLSNTTSLITR